MLQRAIIAQHRQKFTRGRVLDLNIPLGAQQITDLSPYGNNATLKSGVYFSTNGLADKGINADCSAAGSGDYYYTARIRSSLVGEQLAVIGGAAVSVNLAVADVWTDVIFSTAVGVTPSGCIVGFDGTTGFSAADWSDVKLCKVGQANPVAHWQGNDSGASDLNGKFVADSSGNGYHGKHIDCAGGSGEPDILQTAGQNANVRLSLNAQGDSVTLHLNTTLPAALQSLSDAITIRGGFIAYDVSGTAVTSGIWTMGHTIVELRKNDATAKVPFSIGLQGGKFALGVSSLGTAEDERIIGTTALQALVYYTFEVIIDGDDYALKINESTEASGTFVNATGDRSVGSAASSLTVGQRTTDGGALASSSAGTESFFGILDPIEIYDDITGTNKVIEIALDGINSGETLNGTPSTHYIPESDTDNSIGALGSAIDNPRPNDKVINLLADNAYSIVAHDASLNLTNKATWLIWGNFYTAPVSGNESYFAKTNATGSKRSWHILHESAHQTTGQLEVILSSNGSVVSVGDFSGLTDKIQLIAITFDGTQGTAIDRVKMYADAIDLGPATMISGTWPASLYVNSEPIYIGARNNGGSIGNYSTRPLSSACILDRTLTATEILARFNATKSQYGL